MAQVTIDIAGRSYTLACKEGGEAHLRSLASSLGAKADRLIEQLGPMNEPRLMLMAGLMLADELHDMRTGNALPPAAPDHALQAALATLADRAEALATRLESNASPDITA